MDLVNVARCLAALLVSAKGDPPLWYTPSGLKASKQTKRTGKDNTTVWSINVFRNQYNQTQQSSRFLTNRKGNASRTFYYSHCKQIQDPTVLEYITAMEEVRGWTGQHTVRTVQEGLLGVP
jgi:hypothetical protein